MKKKPNHAKNKALKGNYRLKETVYSYIMIAPCLAFLLVFTIYPALNMIYLSFFDYNLLTEKRFIGWDNYRRLFFVNVDFWAAFKHTVYYAVCAVAAEEYAA